MKRFLKIFLPALLFIVFLQSGCTDKNVVIDQNNEVTAHNWTYENKYKFNFNIDDAAATYNLYTNLRITADYKYSNMFVLITQSGPDKKATAKRYEIQLADKDGEWLGKGSGNLYSYQYPFLTGYKFPAKGTYTVFIEQNMRDNPLKEVSDVGLKVERAP